MATNNLELIRTLDRLRLGNLYVHNDELPDINFKTPLLKTRKVYLVETLAIINALVDKGTMLLYGGHGGGKTTLAKYLGQVFYKLSKDAIEDCILRGHPQLTEEKILGSLDIAQLTGAKELNAEKKVDVIWNDFVDSPWKIIDEINRLSPYAQNILLSLLAESSVKYHNESKRLPNFSLYATMNPKDDANFPMSPPFLDRFALALPITMPDYESLSTIGREKDKSYLQDALPTYLKDFDLKTAQVEVRELKPSEEAELFINFIISSFRLCDRIPKEANEALTVKKGLCDGCHFNAPDKVCNKINNPLSVRVKEDFFRYGKALAWFLGDVEVETKHIKTLAPFIIWHRSELNEVYVNLLKDKLKNKRLEEFLFYGKIEIEAIRQIMNLIFDEFEGILPLLTSYEQVKKGKLSVDEFKKFSDDINDPNFNNLIRLKELKPVIEKDYKPVYEEIINYNSKIENAGLNELNNLKDELSTRYDIPNRQFMADLIEKKRRKIGSESLPKHTLKIPFDNFEAMASKGCDSLYRIIKAKFNDKFDPAFLKTEVLADLGGSEFSLTMEKLNEGSGKYSLRFVYQGKEDNPIYEFLAINNVG